MEKQLSNVSMLSLQELALRKVLVLLWNAPRSLLRVRNFRFGSSMPCDYPKDWSECVSYESSKLHLPELIEKKMRLIMKPIGLQLIRWKLFHEAYLHDSKNFFDVPVLKKLQWTAAGTVDYRKTVEELVRCDVLDIEKRYKLACLYCLDDYIPELWKELPQENKMHFYNGEEAPLGSVPPLHYYWPYILKGEEYKLDRMTGNLNTFNDFTFQFLSSQGNKAAAQYFFQKLSLKERGASLIGAVNNALEPRGRNMSIYPDSFPSKNISDVVFCLLSGMTPEQQVQIISARPADVLGCFFDWPGQDAFLDLSDTLWTWMQCEDLASRAKNYDILLKKMQRSIQKSDYYLPNLFQNLFTSSPSDFRKHFVEQECCFATFFMELFTIQDTETINVILCNLDAGDKLRLASSRRMLDLFHFTISRGRGNVVEMFLREAGLSKEDKLSVKDGLMEIMKRWDSGPNESGTPKWTKIFDFLDETEARVQIKTSSDGETLSEAKRLRCEK